MNKKQNGKHLFANTLHPLRDFIKVDVTKFFGNRKFHFCLYSYYLFRYILFISEFLHIYI